MRKETNYKPRNTEIKRENWKRNKENEKRNTKTEGYTKLYRKIPWDVYCGMELP
jgi:hypothetical protein